MLKRTEKEKESRRNRKKIQEKVKSSKHDDHTSDLGTLERSSMINVHVYVCKCVYVFKCVCLCVSVYVYVFEREYVCMQMCMRECACIFM